MFEVLWKSWWAQHTDLFRSAQTMTVCKLWTQVTATHCEVSSVTWNANDATPYTRVLYGPAPINSFLFAVFLTWIFFIFLCREKLNLGVWNICCWNCPVLKHSFKTRGCVWSKRGRDDSSNESIVIYYCLTLSQTLMNTVAKGVGGVGGKISYSLYDLPITSMSPCHVIRSHRYNVYNGSNLCMLIIQLA